MNKLELTNKYGAVVTIIYDNPINGATKIDGNTKFRLSYNEVKEHICYCKQFGSIKGNPNDFGM